MLAKNKSTVFDFWLCPGAFIGSGEETFVINLSKRLKVFLQGLSVDQDVVYISSRELSHVLANIIHVLVKCRRSISQSERHDLVRKGAVLGP